MKRVLSLFRRRTIYAVGLIIILIVGVSLTIFAYTGSPVVVGSFQWKQLAAALGEALIIAFILALLVDPLAQHQLAVDWGRDVYWAIFSPDAPEKFKNALQSLAAPSGYIGRCTYELLFSKYDDAIVLKITVRADGVVLDRRGFRPNDEVFVFAQCDGLPSSYSAWSFRSQDISRDIDLTAADLAKLGAVTGEPSGRTVLDQAKIRDVEKVPFRGQYETVRRVETKRRYSDYFPLFQNRIVLEQVFLLRGDVLNELDISVVQLGGVTLDRREETSPGGETIIRYSTSNVAFPGQASMVEWQPKNHPFHNYPQSKSTM